MALLPSPHALGIPCLHLLGLKLQVGPLGHGAHMALTHSGDRSSGLPVWVAGVYYGGAFPSLKLESFPMTHCMVKLVSLGEVLLGKQPQANKSNS